MRVQGIYAVHAGAERWVTGHSDTKLWLTAPRDEVVALDAPGVLEKRPDDDPPRYAVQRSAVERLFSARVSGRWHGEEVTVIADEGDQLFVDYFGSPQLAAQHGLQGNWRDGFRGLVPRADVTDVVEDLRDMPLVRPPRT